MAKKNTSTKFTKATISKTEDGRYIIEEVNKDDISSYDFTSVLDSLVGVENLSISISRDCDIEQISE